MSNPFRESLSYASVLSTSVSVDDWREMYGENLDGVRVILPKITRDVLEEYDIEIEPAEFDAAEWFADNPLEDFESEDDRQAALNEAREEFESDDDSSLAQAIRRFEDSDSYYEWKDRFEPAMNFYWPVDIPYDVSEETIAAMIDEHAGATSLVYVESADTYGIVLTGGGMDLSWDICAAYVCCGCVPPATLLEGLPAYRKRSKEMTRFILETCVPKAADFLQTRAERMIEHAASMKAKLLSDD